MTTKNLEKKIIKKVFKLEAKNTFFEMASKVIGLLLLVFFVWIFATTILDILKEQGSFDLFFFFRDNVEVMRRYFLENVVTFYDETPKLLLFILFSLFAGLLLLVLTIVKNYGKISNKIKSLYNFYKKNE